MVESRQLHKGNVMDMQLSKDGTHLITASTDMTAKLVDTESLEVMKTYPFERPCNSAAVSPIYDHVRSSLSKASLKPPSPEHLPRHNTDVFGRLFPVLSGKISFSLLQSPVQNLHLKMC